MSIGVNQVFNIPYETSLSAHQIYGNNHIYLKIGDNLEKIYNKIEVSFLDPSSQMTGDNAFRVALACAFQFAESLPDSSTANATMKRVDWKYALFLPISHPGFSVISLSNFRQRLCSSSKAIQAFGNLLIELEGLGLFASSHIHSLDPRLALSVICQTNRLFDLMDGMKAALGLIASIAPEWVKGQVSPHWYQRYKTGPLRSLDFSQLSDFQIHAERMGSDIFALLTSLKKTDAPDLNSTIEIKKLNSLFQAQYQLNGETIQWRSSGCPDCLHNLKVSEGGFM